MVSKVTQYKFHLNRLAWHQYCQRYHVTYSDGCMLDPQFPRTTAVELAQYAHDASFLACPGRSVDEQVRKVAALDLKGKNDSSELEPDQRASCPVLTSFFSLPACSLW